MKTILSLLCCLLSIAAAQTTGDYQIPKWDGTKFVPQLITPAADSLLGWNGSTVPQTVAIASLVTLTDGQTLSNKTLSAPVITGGSIDGAAIGGTTPAAGTFAAATVSAAAPMLALANTTDSAVYYVGAKSPNISNGSVYLAANWNPDTGAIPKTATSSSYIEATANAGGSIIRFLTGTANNQQPSERMRVDIQGNLLVGTTSGTGDKLRVGGSISSTANITTSTNLVASGTTNTNGFQTAFRVVSTATTTAAATDHTLICNASSAAITVNLPAAGSNTGREYTVKKTDATANTVTIDGNGSETVDGSTTYAISVQWRSVTIKSSGAGWFIVASHTP